MTTGCGWIASMARCSPCAPNWDCSRRPSFSSGFCRPPHLGMGPPLPRAPPQLGRAPPLPAASAAAPAPGRTAARPAPRRKVGFWENLLGNPPPLTSSRMASYSFEKGGGFLVTLENGERWRQTDVEGGTARWTREPAEYLVTINPGPSGTYFLRTDEGPQTYKVQPVK